MPDLWIGTSFKMNKTIAESLDYANGLREFLAKTDLPGIQPFIIPSFTALHTVDRALADRNILKIGAQNGHWDDAGAWTGEVAIAQAKDAGAQIIEIGHSERREFFNETNETTRLKVVTALRHGLIPLLCVGEPDEVKSAGGSTEFILGQAEAALEGLSTEELAQVVIAYEPIWAIGVNGRPATAEDLTDPFNALGKRFGGKVKALLYGGSVNLNNAEELLGINHVQGLFVGRTAWELPGYIKLLEIADKYRNRRQ